MSIELKDIYWLAGILEGEGTFATNNSPEIRLAMTDRDIVIRARNLLNGNVNIKVTPAKYPNKEVYTIGIYGFHAIQWMYTLYPILGERRRSRITEVVRVWNTSTNRHKNSPVCRKGHRLDEYGKDFIMNSLGSKMCRKCMKINQEAYQRRLVSA